MVTFDSKYSSYWDQVFFTFAGCGDWEGGWTGDSGEYVEPLDLLLVEWSGVQWGVYSTVADTGQSPLKYIYVTIGPDPNPRKLFLSHHHSNTTIICFVFRKIFLEPGICRSSCKCHLDMIEKQKQVKTGARFSRRWIWTRGDNEPCLQAEELLAISDSWI